MKKLLSLVLSLIMCLSINVIASADIEPTISISVKDQLTEVKVQGLAPNSFISFQAFLKIGGETEQIDYLDQFVTDASGEITVTYPSSKTFAVGDVIRVVIGGGGLAKPIEASYKEHKVTFLVDGDEYAVVIVKNGEAVARPPADPKKFGYTFVGWQKGEEIFDLSNAITEDITLEAQWELNPITSIKIDVNVTDTVKRGEVYRYNLILNEDAIDINVVWTVSDPSFALIDDEGNVYILNKTGTVRLIATDPISGLWHSITLRIAS